MSRPAAAPGSNRTSHIAHRTDRITRGAPHAYVHPPPCRTRRVRRGRPQPDAHRLRRRGRLEGQRGRRVRLRRAGYEREQRWRQQQQRRRGHDGFDHHRLRHHQFHDHRLRHHRLGHLHVRHRRAGRRQEEGHRQGPGLHRRRREDLRGQAGGPADHAHHTDRDQHLGPRLHPAPVPAARVRRPPPDLQERPGGRQEQARHPHRAEQPAPRPTRPCGSTTAVSTRRTTPSAPST